MEHRRDEEPKLLIDGFGLDNVGLHECRVSDLASFLAQLLTSLRFTAKAGTNTCTISMSIQQLRNNYILNYSSSTISYPRCTNSFQGQLIELNTDCGSEKWALSLAIAWNLLSMVSGLRTINMSTLT